MSRGTPADDRHRARQAAVQMLYQWEIGRDDPGEVVRTYWAQKTAPAGARTQAFANDLVNGTIAGIERIDPLISASAEHWRLSRMAVLDRLILRLAVYELLETPGTPPAVVINEALELARTFSTEESVAFINGVLDDVRKKLQLRESSRIER